MTALCGILRPMAKDDGWHDYGTNPTGPHRPVETAKPKRAKPTEDDVANLRAEQIKRLVRVGADEPTAAALVDEHTPDSLVSRSDDVLESLVDDHRAKGSVDMSTINSVLLWVYGSEDAPNDLETALSHARVALELEEARRRPRHGVLDDLRLFLEENADAAVGAGDTPTDPELAAQGVPVGDAADPGDGDGTSTLPAIPNAPGSNQVPVEEVPEGSIKRVMEWVSNVDDPDEGILRAQTALDAERAKPADLQRSTLISQLEDATKQQPEE